MLGTALAEYFVARCTGAGQTYSRTFLAGGIDNAPATDFNPFSAAQSLDVAGTFYGRAAGGAVAQSLLMYQVWYAAQQEWTGRFP
jgi:hypothetical protein